MCFLLLYHLIIIIIRLTCVFREFFQEFLSVPVLWNVAHKEAVIIERYGNSDSLPFPKLIVIQLGTTMILLGTVLNYFNNTLFSGVP